MTRFDKLMNQAKGKGRRSPEIEPEKVLQPDLKPEAIAPPPAATNPPAKSKDPNYQRSTVYLPKDVHQRLKLAAIQQDKEISEVIEELVRDWLKHLDV